MQTNAGIESYNNFKKILYTTEDGLCTILCDKYISGLNLGKTLTMCDIGGGDGNRTLKICNFIHTYFHSKIKLDFVEQSGLMCKKFKEKSVHLSAFCDINIIENSIEKVNLINKYDVVLFIHSIFSLKNFDAFQLIYNKLNEDGVIIVVTNGADSFLRRLKLRIDEDYSDKRYEIDELTNNLTENKIGFETSNFNTIWSLAKFEAADKIKRILEWLSLGRFNTWGASRKLNLIKHAKEMAVMKMGRYYFSEKEEILIIRHKKIN